MTTNEKDRKRWSSVGVYARIPPQDVYRLIADVNEATALLGEAVVAISAGAGTYDLAERIADFLKEPRQ